MTKHNCGNCRHGFCERTPTGKPKKGTYVDCQIPQSVVKDVMTSIKTQLPVSYWYSLDRADVVMCGMEPTDGEDCTLWEARQ